MRLNPPQRAAQKPRPHRDHTSRAAVPRPEFGRMQWPVGYGDVVPQTVGGRMIAAALMFVGIGFLSMLTATSASSFASQDVAEEVSEEERATEGDLAEVLAAQRRIEKRLDNLETGQ